MPDPNIALVVRPAEERLANLSHETGLSVDGYEALMSALADAGFWVVSGPDRIL